MRAEPAILPAQTHQHSHAGIEVSNFGFDVKIIARVAGLLAIHSAERPQFILPLQLLGHHAAGDGVLTHDLLARMRGQIHQVRRNLVADGRRSLVRNHVVIGGRDQDGVGAFTLAAERDFFVILRLNRGARDLSGGVKPGTVNVLDVCGAPPTRQVRPKKPRTHSYDRRRIALRAAGCAGLPPAWPAQPRGRSPPNSIRATTFLVYRFIKTYPYHSVSCYAWAWPEHPHIRSSF